MISWPEREWKLRALGASEEEIYEEKLKYWENLPTQVPDLFLDTPPEELEATRLQFLGAKPQKTGFLPALGRIAKQTAAGAISGTIGAFEYPVEAAAGALGADVGEFEGPAEMFRRWSEEVSEPTSKTEAFLRSIASMAEPISRIGTSVVTMNALFNAGAMASPMLALPGAGPVATTALTTPVAFGGSEYAKTLAGGGTPMEAFEAGTGGAAFGAYLHGAGEVIGPAIRGAAAKLPARFVGPTAYAGQAIGTALPFGPAALAQGATLPEAGEEVIRMAVLNAGLMAPGYGGVKYSALAERFRQKELEARKLETQATVQKWGREDPFVAKALDVRRWIPKDYSRRPFGELPVAEGPADLPVTPEPFDIPTETLSPQQRAVRGLRERAGYPFGYPPEAFPGRIPEPVLTPFNEPESPGHAYMERLELPKVTAPPEGVGARLEVLAGQVIETGPPGRREWTRDQLKDALSVTFRGMTPRNVEAATDLSMKMLEALAAARGTTVADLTSRLFADIRPGTGAEHQASFRRTIEGIRKNPEAVPEIRDFIIRQMRETGVDENTALMEYAKRGGIQAMVEYLNDGRAIMKAWGLADSTTFFHELFHVFRGHLPTTDQMRLLEFIARPGEKWNIKHEEIGANLFTEALRGNMGTLNIPGDIREIIMRARPWLRDSASGIGIDNVNRLIRNEDVKKVFDRMLKGWADDPVTRAYEQVDRYVPGGPLRDADVIYGAIHPEEVKTFTDAYVPKKETPEQKQKRIEFMNAVVKHYKETDPDGIYQALMISTIAKANPKLAEELAQEKFGYTLHAMWLDLARPEFPELAYFVPQKYRTGTRELAAVYKPDITTEKQAKQKADIMDRLRAGTALRPEEFRSVEWAPEEKKWLKTNMQPSYDKKSTFLKQADKNPLVIDTSKGVTQRLEDVGEIIDYVLKKPYAEQSEFNNTLAKYTDAASRLPGWGPSKGDEVMKGAMRHPLYGASVTVNPNPPRAKYGMGATEKDMPFIDKWRQRIGNWVIGTEDVLKKHFGPIGDTMAKYAHKLTDDINMNRANLSGKVVDIMFGDAKLRTKTRWTKGQSIAIAKAIHSRSAPTDQQALKGFQEFQELEQMVIDRFVQTDRMQTSESKAYREEMAYRLSAKLRKDVLQEDVLQDMISRERASRYWEEISEVTAKTRNISRDEADTRIARWLDDIRSLNKIQEAKTPEFRPDEELIDLAAPETAAGPRGEIVDPGSIVIPEGFLNSKLGEVLDKFTRVSSGRIAELNNQGEFGAIMTMLKGMPTPKHIGTLLELYEKMVTQVPLSPNMPLIEGKSLRKIHSAIVSMALSGRAPLSNILGTMNNHWLAGDWKSVGEGIRNYIKDIQSGIISFRGISPFGVELEGISGYKPPSEWKFINILRELHPFPGSEKVARLSGFEIGMVRAEELFKKAIAGDKMAIEDLKRYVIDYQKFMAQMLAWTEGKNIPEIDRIMGRPEQLVRAGLEMSRESSLPMEAYRAPVKWDEPLGRFLSTFRRFGLQQWLLNYRQVANDFHMAGKYHQLGDTKTANAYRIRATQKFGKEVIGSAIAGLFIDSIWKAITGRLDTSIAARMLSADEDTKNDAADMAGLWFESILTAGFGGLVMDLLGTVANVGGRSYGVSDQLFGFNLARVNSAYRIGTTGFGDLIDMAAYAGDGRALSAGLDLTREAWTGARTFIPGLKIAEGVVSGFGLGFQPELERHIDKEAWLDSTRKGIMDAVKRGNMQDFLKLSADYKQALQETLSQAISIGDAQKIEQYSTALNNADKFLNQREEWLRMPNEMMRKTARQQQLKLPGRWGWLSSTLQ